MKNTMAILKQKYPAALVWQFGDTPEMANELSNLVIKGIKTAGCGSLTALKSEETPPTIGCYNIILNGEQKPVCVIRTIAMRLIRFCDVTEDIAKKEGEGDLSLQYWSTGHQEFFERAGTYTYDMELVVEEFELIDVL